MSNIIFITTYDQDATNRTAQGKTANRSLTDYYGHKNNNQDTNCIYVTCGVYYNVCFRVMVATNKNKRRLEVCKEPAEYQDWKMSEMKQ